MASTVFTYGSLMFPEVWRRVVRGSYASLAAEMVDHARFAIEGETYPGMVAQPGARVAGVAYLAVSDDDIARLDHFEGCDYRRVSLTARTFSGRALAVDGYLYLPLHKLAQQDWQPESFRLQDFLQTYCRDKLGD